MTHSKYTYVHKHIHIIYNRSTTCWATSLAGELIYFTFRTIYIYIYSVHTIRFAKSWLRPKCVLMGDPSPHSATVPFPWTLVCSLLKRLCYYFCTYVHSWGGQEKTDVCQWASHTCLRWLHCTYYTNTRSNYRQVSAAERHSLDTLSSKTATHIGNLSSHIYHKSQPT